MVTAKKTHAALKGPTVDYLRFNLSAFERDLFSLRGEVPSLLGVPRSLGLPSVPNPLDFSFEYLYSEIMSKFDDGKTNELKSKTTWERFHMAEGLCFQTNQRLQVQGLDGPFPREIHLAKEIASRILGPFDWDLAAKGFGWGPGASTRLPRRLSDAAYKFSGTPETTIGNAVLADAAIRHIPVWKQALDQLPPADLGYCKIVPGNRIVTVPKNFKTDRTIAIEPDMNMYIQKGIGALMRKRLNLAGCDLSDQTKNQRLARIGAFSGQLATIDLSMASDTVSRVLVNKFIRADWLEALEQSRSPFGVLPSGEKIFYQKFSSMGNGFTFELESLIFYSLALAYCQIHAEKGYRVAVYGDDIIVPSAVAEGFIGLLQHVGFQTNEKKSYWNGPFRESCGKHYFLEHDITPFYVRRPVTRLSDLFLLHNNLYRWAKRLKSIDASMDLTPLLAKIRRLAPAKWRKPRLPDGFGDGAFIGEFDELSMTLHPDGWEAWVVKVLAPTSSVDYVDVPGLLPKSLHNLHRKLDGRTKWLPTMSETEFEVHPSRVERYREMKIAIPQYALINNN